MFPRSNRWDAKENKTPGPGDYEVAIEKAPGTCLAAVQSRTERFVQPPSDVPGVGAYETGGVGRSSVAVPVRPPRGPSPSSRTSHVAPQVTAGPSSTTSSDAMAGVAGLTARINASCECASLEEVRGQLQAATAQLDAVQVELTAALQDRNACLERLAGAESAATSRISALEAEVATALHRARCVEEKCEAEVEEAVAAVVNQYTAFIEGMREEHALERVQAQADLEAAQQAADSIAAARLGAAEALAEARLAAAGRDHDSAVLHLQQQMEVQLQAHAQLQQQMEEQARTLEAEWDAKVARAAAEFATERQQLTSALEEAKGDVASAFRLHDLMAAEWKKNQEASDRKASEAVEAARRECAEYQTHRSQETSAYMDAIADFKALYEREQSLRVADTAKVQAMSMDLTACAGRVVELEAALSAVNASLSQLRHDSGTELASLTLTNAQLLAEVSSVTAALRAAEATSCQHLEENTRLASAVQTAEKEHAAVHTSLLHVQATLVRVQDDYSAACTALSRAEASAVELAQRVAQEESRAALLQCEAEDAIAGRATAQASVDHLTTAHAAAVCALEVLQREHVVQAAALTAAQAASCAVQDNVAALECKAQRLEADLVSARATIAQLQSASATQAEAVDRGVAALDALRGEHAAALTALSSLKQQCQEAEASTAAASALVASLSAELEDARQQQAGLQQRIAVEVEASAGLRASVAAAQGACAEHLQQAMDAQASLGTALVHARQLEDANATLHHQVETLTKEGCDVAAALAACQGTVAQLVVEKGALEERVQHLAAQPAVDACTLEQLLTARERAGVLQAGERAALDRLREVAGEVGRLAGHQNPRQKIHYMEGLKRENEELKAEVAKLRALLPATASSAACKVSFGGAVDKENASRPTMGGAGIAGTSHTLRL